MPGNKECSKTKIMHVCQADMNLTIGKPEQFEQQQNNILDYNQSP